MFKRFHIQMTFFCTLIISFVIVGMTVAYLSISESSVQSINYANFLTNCNTSLSYLNEQNIISHEWVSKAEQNNQYLLEIYDNGRPLTVTNQRLTKEQLVVIDVIKETSNDLYSLDLNSPLNEQESIKQVSFHLVIDEDKFYATTALIPKMGGVIGVVIYQPLSIHTPAIVRQRILFLSVDVIATLILGVFSWFFTAQLIKPIEKNRKQQIAFIASASHELRTPLAVILSSLSAMKKGNLQESERFAETIQSEGNRMARLIDDMLALANADSHNWSIQSEPVDMDTLLLDIYEKYEYLAVEKGFQLDIVLPEEAIPKCRCDKLRIEQVLSILLDNAMEYTPNDGIIRLSIYHRSHTLILKVADNGLGIPPEQREQIFQRFYRADASHTKKNHFGLGLSIAKEIIKLHRGIIYVEDGIDCGACFTIELPLNDKEKKTPFSNL
jgi:signal transduction histidine kinase